MKLIKLELVEIGAIQGLAVVDWNGLIIHNIKIIKQPNQRAFVRLPEHEIVRGEEKKFYQFLKLRDEKVRKKLENLILPKFYEELAKRKTGLETGLNKKIKTR